MKKSLIVIALALLIIVPVFADDTQDSSSATATPSYTVANTATSAENKGDATQASEVQKTEVNVELKLTPKYAFGVTGGKINGDETNYVTPYGSENYVIYTVEPTNKDSGKTYVDYTTLKRISVISMVANEADMVLEGPDSNTYKYYISYWFFENNTESVKLYAWLDGNLTLQNRDKTKQTVDANCEIPYQVTIALSNGDVILSSKTSSDTNKQKIVEADVQNYIGATQEGDVAITLAPLENEESIADKYVGTYKSNIVLQVLVG